MITRIEIDGFKSFVDFSLDLHPFTAVIGTNASGKSNLIDAFRFLSAAAKGDLYDAVDAVRGDAESLFHQFSDGTRVDRMRFALEFLVELPGAVDGRDPEDGFTRWRYEADIGWGELAGRVALVFEQERIRPLNEGHWFAFVGATAGWTAARNRLALQESDPDLVFRDSSVPASSLLSYKLFDQPRPGFMGSIKRIREDLAGIRSCQFEAAALRRLSPLADRPDMAEDGSGLPIYLARIGEDTRTEDNPRGVLHEIGLSLGGIVPDITGFDVIEDKVRRDVRIEFTARNEPPFEASVASDGTLRTLAILAALNDPRQTSPLLIEEPENGIYPERLRKLLGIMQESVTDPRSDDPTWPLRQVLVASHSPVVLDTVAPEHLVFIDVVSRAGNGKTSRVTRARRAVESGAADSTANWGALTPQTLERLRSGGEMPD